VAQIGDELLERVFGERLVREGDKFRLGGRDVPFRNGILRFTPDVSYATGNFSRLRERHARLQLDSANGTRDRLDTILARTRWPREFFGESSSSSAAAARGPIPRCCSVSARVS